MTPETDQTASPLGVSAAGGSSAAVDKKAGTKVGSKPRAGVPVWRTGKPDAFLAAAVDVARAAIEGIAPAEQIGRHLAAKSEGDRLVTHLFESKLAGYGGWQWYAVLTRNSRSKVVTVDELGLLPSDDSILAPEWIPWAERVRPGDEQGEDEPGRHRNSGAPGGRRRGRPRTLMQRRKTTPTTPTATRTVPATSTTPTRRKTTSSTTPGDDAGDAPEGELTAAEAD